MPGFDDVRSRNGIGKGGKVLRLRRLIAVLAGLCVLAWTDTSAQAQQIAGGPAAKGAASPAVRVPPVADPSIPPAASPPDKASQATPAAPTLEHIAKARRLILATGISRSFEIIVPEFMDQIGNTLTQARPDLVHDMIVTLDELKPEFERQSDEMIDLSSKIYATLLSEKDIDAILAFYDSDAGKKYVAAQSLYINQLIPGSQAWQQKIAINMMARVRQEMKKKGHNL